MWFPQSALNPTRAGKASELMRAPSMTDGIPA
jgi:hypothetical protein